MNEHVRVLLLDDEPKLLRAYERLLVQAGCECLTSDRGEDALLKLTVHTVDVVLTDLMMPGMSGIEFMNHARKDFPDLPILVVTGAPDMDHAIQSIDAGVFRYLRKPVSPDELSRAVQDAVSMGALARARRAAFSHLSGEKMASSSTVLNALESGFLALQPIIDTSAQRVIGQEAFLRTHEPKLRAPRALLSAAEHHALLPAVGRTVRALAAKQIPALPEDQLLFINTHAHDLLDDRLYSRSEPLLSFAPRVILEIAERHSLSGIPDAAARVNTLKSLGYRIALDDMGAGYAGLASFIMLKPDFIKFDLTLVRDVDSDEIKQTLVKTMVALSRSLGMDVIAGGVETVRERDTLVGLGCVLHQGHLFARPSPA